MKRIPELLRRFTRWVMLLLVLPVLAQHAGAASQPNILVIWGDDIGQFNISACAGLDLSPC